MKKFLLFMLALPVIGFSQIFSEDFETTVPPTGWTLNQVNAAETWQETTTAMEGLKSATVLYDAALGAQNEDLISPAIDLSAVTSATLTFLTNSSYYWSISPNDNYDTTLSVSTDAGVTYTQIWSENDLATAEGGTFENYDTYTVAIDLASYLGNADVRFKFNYSGTDGASWTIDDMKIESCTAPTNLSFDGATTTTTTTDVNWDNSGNFELEWGEYPYTQGSGGSTATVTGGTTYQITGLTAATSYNVFVRQDCGGGAYSDWTEVVVGTITDTFTTFPYSEDLTLDANQVFLLNLGLSFAGTTNIWNYGVDDLTDGDTTNDFAYDPSAYVFSNNTFASTDADSYMFVGPFTLTSGTDYTFSFQQRNIVVSDATTPNKDIEIVVASTNDGTGVTVLATLDDLDNITHIQRSSIFTPTTSGDYYFGIHDKSNFLMGVTAGNSVVVDALSVTSNLGVEDINALSSNTVVYPNPVQDTFTVKLSESFNAEATTVSVSDVTGKTVKTFEYAESFNVSSLAKGIYIVTITDGVKTENQKLIKE